MLRLVSGIVKKARDKDLLVMANTGYIYQDALSITQRIKRMWDLGVQLIMVQSIEYLNFLAIRDITRRLEDVIGPPQ